MSFRRHQSFALNTNTFLSGRLSNFVKPHVYYGNLFIEHNLTVYNNVDICGNLQVAGDVSATNFRASGNFYLDGYILVPAGTIIMSATITEPSGWLHCDGRLLDRTVYADLFNAIDLTYTDTSPANMFKIPDFRGRTGVGSYENASDSAYSLTVRNRGQKNGEENHTLSIEEIPSHSHIYNDAYFAEAGGNQINGNNVFGINANTDGDNQFRWRNANGTASTTPGDINTSSVGSGQAHNNMQPFLVVRYLIKY